MQAAERDEFDPQFRDRGTDPRVAERRDLGGPFADVHCFQPTAVARVATELRHTVRKPAKQRDERLRGDQLRVRIALAVLPVEVAAISDPRGQVPDRYTEVPAQIF